MSGAQCARTLENTEFMPLRHCVFKIDPASANHTSRIISNSVDSKKHLYDLLNGFHAEFSCNKPGAANELRQLVKEARQQWAVQLRDTDCRDIEVVIAHEYHGRGIDRYITARVKAIKQDLEAVGGSAYHQYPFKKKDRDAPWAVLCVVVPQAGIEAVLTKQRMAAHAITFDDITAPASDDERTIQPSPGCQFWYRNDDSSLVIVPTPKDTIRHRSASIDRIRDAPPGTWDPYSRPQTVEQQQRSSGRKPFSAELYEPESNSNWIERDFATRCEQLEQYDKSRLSSPELDDVDEALYPCMSSTTTRDVNMHGGKEQSYADIERDYLEIEAQIEKIETDHKVAREKLDRLVRRGTLTAAQIRNSKEAHDALYTELEKNKLPTLRNVLGGVATSLTSAKSWPDHPKRDTVIMQSKNGSTIWEEPIVEDVPDNKPQENDIPVGKPPTETKTTWWSKVQKMFAGSGRPKAAQTKPTAVERRDSAVSFAAGVAADVATGGIVGELPTPAQASASLRAIMDATGVPRPGEGTGLRYV